MYRIHDTRRAVMHIHKPNLTSGLQVAAAAFGRTVAMSAARREAHAMPYLIRAISHNREPNACWQYMMKTVSSSEPSDIRSAGRDAEA